jgi:hypothetical protein
MVEALVAGGARRVGLTELLRRRGRRAWPAWVRGAAAHRAFRWNLRDTFDSTWWPQGIDLAEIGERRVLAVSWFAHPVRGVEMGVRLTFVDLTHTLPRYHHVLLVEPVRDAAGGIRLDPVVVHAGGIGWISGGILVADTFGGLREYRLDDLLQLETGVFGHTEVLPQHARYRAHRASGDRGMRFSFVSIEHGGDTPRLVAGEYGDGSRGDRLVRLDLDDTGRPDVDERGRSIPGELHEPGIWRMQGVCVVDGTWYLTTSNGPRRGGDLWVGAPGALTRYKSVLPAGPEDLAYEPVTGRLWSLSEWPGRRRVFSIDPGRWNRGTSPAAAAAH